VWHITLESEKGIVIDVMYKYRADQFEYLVSTGFGQEFWCFAEEISKERRVI
jgi:hypothetical protein